MTWLYMALETVLFLALSAGMWRVIKNADREPVASDVKHMTPAPATADRAAEIPAARELEEARR